MAWSIKSADVMSISMDTLQNPISSAQKDTVCQRVKNLGATMIAISVPYDGPQGSDPIGQKTDWVRAARAQGLKVWHRSSWITDEGWYGATKNTTNDRIADTKNYILSHAAFYQNGDIFTPKPEPQNMGVNGINDKTPFRFASIDAFNQWLRDITVACKAAFTQLGLDVKVGMWGFDGFVTCGYGNSYWQGRVENSGQATERHPFLEVRTVQALDNLLTVDHYPSSKPMSDFLTVFKAAWPNVKFLAGEYGAINAGDPVTQIQDVLTDLQADPIVIGLNYWQMGPAGNEALLNADLSIKPAYTMVQTFYGFNTPTQPPTTTPDTDQLNRIEKKLDDELTKLSPLQAKEAATKGILYSADTNTTKVNKLKAIWPQ